MYYEFNLKNCSNKGLQLYVDFSFNIKSNETNVNATANVELNDQDTGKMFTGNMLYLKQ